MASWGERLTRISAEITDVKRVVVVVVVVGLHLIPKKFAFGIIMLHVVGRIASVIFIGQQK